MGRGRVFPPLLVGLLLSGQAWALCEDGTGPDCVSEQETFRGTVDFFATGAAFTVNNDADDRPDALIDVAEVSVARRRIPVSATLTKAFLYFGGSLYDDNDGIDAPDMEVEIQVPGSSEFVRAAGEQVYQTEPIEFFEEVSLYNVRADITEIMRAAGGEMVGTYRVRGFDADIFDGTQEHTAANASFSIILIFEEPRLPPRNIVLFDGMQEVLGSTVTLDLSGFVVSQVPSGQLTIYAQEGDCNPGPTDCAAGDNLSGLERLRVIGADPARTLVPSGPFNPPNDIFNRTINTVDPPLTNVTGTDIDRFDITPVLRTGDESIRVEVTSPLPANGNSGELVGLAYVIVGIDVFVPELNVDSRIKIRTERGEKLEAYFPGDPLRVTYALSNTGNLRGDDVELITELPSNATAYSIVSVQEGATATDDPSGGAAMRGRVEVEGMTVRNGEIEALTMLVETECPLPDGGTFSISGDVTAPRAQVENFTLTTTVALLPRDICGPRFFLFGGGGCQTVSGYSESSVALGLFLLALLFALRRRAVRALFLLLIVSCSTDITTAPDRPAPVEKEAAICPVAADMIAVALPDTDPFCIDRYEALIGADGAARSERFVFPSAGVSWEQARSACELAGKRLCTAEEWVLACRGPEDLTFPYGDTYDGDTCNGFDATRGDVVETGAMLVGVPRPDGVFEAQGCVGALGIYDMSGNVAEWNATGYFDDIRRGVAGGGFRANRIGLRCVTDDNHAPPDEQNDAFGFRCCKDAL